MSKTAGYKKPGLNCGSNFSFCDLPLEFNLAQCVILAKGHDCGFRGPIRVVENQWKYVVIIIIIPYTAAQHIRPGVYIIFNYNQLSPSSFSERKKKAKCRQQHHFAVNNAVAPKREKKEANRHANKQKRQMQANRTAMNGVIKKAGKGTAIAQQQFCASLDYHQGKYHHLCATHCST